MILDAVSLINTDPPGIHEPKGSSKVLRLTCVESGDENSQKSNKHFKSYSTEALHLLYIDCYCIPSTYLNHSLRPSRYRVNAILPPLHEGSNGHQTTVLIYQSEHTLQLQNDPFCSIWVTLCMFHDDLLQWQGPSGQILEPQLINWKTKRHLKSGQILSSHPSITYGIFLAESIKNVHAEMLGRSSIDSQSFRGNKSWNLELIELSLSKTFRKDSQHDANVCKCLPLKASV